MGEMKHKNQAEHGLKKHWFTANIQQALRVNNEVANKYTENLAIRQKES